MKTLRIISLITVMAAAFSISACDDYITTSITTSSDFNIRKSWESNDYDYALLGQSGDITIGMNTIEIDGYWGAVEEGKTRPFDGILKRAPLRASFEKGAALTQTGYSGHTGTITIYMVSSEEKIINYRYYEVTTTWPRPIFLDVWADGWEDTLRPIEN